MHITAISPFNRKVIIVATTIFMFMVMFDVFIDIVTWLFHSLIELFDILFETLEIVLDRSVEHLLHTGLHETQVIVFYVLLSCGGWGGYKICHGLPAWSKNWLVMFNSICSNQIQAVVYDWKTQSLLQKAGSIALFGFFTTGFYYFFL